MVRRRIELKPIEQSSKRHTTFTKRRTGLIKKTMDFCDKFDYTATVITFSKAGNAYAFGHPSVDSILDRYIRYSSSSSPSSAVTLSGGVQVQTPHGGGELAAPDKSPSSQLSMDAQKRVSEAIGKGRPAWDAAMENLGFRELDELAAAVESIKSEVAARKMEVESRGKGALEGGFFTGDL